MQNAIGQYSLNVTLSLLDGQPSQEGQQEKIWSINTRQTIEPVTIQQL